MVDNESIEPLLFKLSETDYIEDVEYIERRNKLLQESQNVCDHKKHVGYVYIWKDSSNEVRTHIANRGDDIVSVLVRTTKGTKCYSGPASLFWVWGRNRGIKITVKSIEVELNIHDL